MTYTQQESCGERSIMNRSLQEYFEYLVSTQSDSIQRYFKKNGLLNYISAFALLSEQEKDCIRNGYENNIRLRADYIFSELRKRHTKRISATKNRVINTQKKTYIIEFAPLKISLKHSDLLSLQDIFQQRISRLSQQFLASHCIYGIEQILPYVIGEKSVSSLLKECYGSKTRTEIYEALKVLRLKLENKGKNETAFSLNTYDEKRREGSNELSEENNELLENGYDEHNVEEKTHQDSIELLFDRWYKQLSARIQHILALNGMSNRDSFFSKIEEEGFSFNKLQLCGLKNAEELELMAGALKHSILNNSIVRSEKEHTDLRETLNTSLLCTDLSVRAKNCLSKAQIWTLWDLVSLDESSVMAINNLGKKTFYELKSFVKKRNLCFGYRSYQLDYYNASNYALNNPVIKKLKLTDEEKKFVHYYLNKYGFMPMVCILVKCIQTVLGNFELYVIEDRFGIKVHDDLKKIDNSRIRYFFENANKKLKNDTTIKALCALDDWKNYGVYDLPTCDWFLKLESKLINVCRCESDELFNFSIEKQEFSLFNFESELSPISYNSFVLQFFGMTCFWINNTTSEMSRYNSFDSSEWVSTIFIKNHFCSFKYTKAINEVVRLSRIKTDENIIISIKKYFVENEDNWSKPIKLTKTEKDSMVDMLSALFKSICYVKINDGTILIRANKMNYSERLYEILKIAGKRLHRDELFKRLKKVCYEKGFYVFDYTDPSQITPFLTKDPRIQPYGKSGFWGLKEWGNTTGSIREISIKLVRKARKPIQIEELTKEVLLLRPDSNEKSVVSIIRQAGATKDLLIFYGDYVGHPKRNYLEEYTLMPQSFDEWLQAFKKFVIDNKRLPYSGVDGYEGYLYRWHYRGSQFTNLSPDEILKLDELDTELALYPQNATEYNFLQKCNLYKKFVESHKRMLTKDDDSELFNWFYMTRRNYNKYDDNRNKYFSQLLQYLSSIIY